MSRTKAMVHWTCDRCGVDIAVPQGEQPAAWSHMSLFAPPLAREDDYQMTSGGSLDLCRQCTRAAQNFGREYARPETVA